MRALAADYGLVTATSQLLPFVVAGVAGFAAAGGLRAAVVVFGVVNVVVGGLIPVATVDAARLAGSARPFVRRFVWRWSASIAVLVAAYASVVLVVPDGMGAALFADTWLHAKPVLLPLALTAMLNGPIVSTQVVLRACNRLRDALLLRTRTAVGLIVLSMVGALVADSVGAAWGLAVASAIGAGLAITASARVELTDRGPAAGLSAAPPP
jgi:hypothetical protein